jgi:hypothetical protein
MNAGVIFPFKWVVLINTSFGCFRFGLHISTQTCRRSPRMRRASWMSLGHDGDTLGIVDAELVSSKAGKVGTRQLLRAEQQSLEQSRCLKSEQSRTRRKGSLRMRNSVARLLVATWWVSTAILLPMSSMAGSAALASWPCWRNCFLRTLPPVDFLAVCPILSHVVV